jgi:hypothetical protein
MTEAKPEVESAHVSAFEAFGKGRSWESAFQNLNQYVALSTVPSPVCIKSPSRSCRNCRAVELIYLMCELESSVIFVDHAARVFNEASEDFKELKLRIQDQLRFQSYIEVLIPTPSGRKAMFNACTLVFAAQLLQRHPAKYCVLFCRRAMWITCPSHGKYQASSRIIAETCLTRVQPAAQTLPVCFFLPSFVSCTARHGRTFTESP